MTSLQAVKPSQPNEIVISDSNVSVSTATKTVSTQPGAKSNLIMNQSKQDDKNKTDGITLSSDSDNDGD